MTKKKNLNIDSFNMDFLEEKKKMKISLIFDI